MQRVWSSYLENGQPAGASPLGHEGLHRRENSRGANNSGSMDNTSPRASIISHANSAYSNADSTRHILSSMNHQHSSMDFGLAPPNAPFASASGNAYRGSPDNLSLASNAGSNSNLSLSVNYLPTKFSASIVSARKRGKGKMDDDDGLRMPKRGGGTDAFRSGEARMENGPGRTKLRWTKFKWIIFVTNTLMFLYSIAALIVCLLVWFDVWTHADLLRVGNRPELILSTIAASVGIITSVIGFAGILMNNRTFLAIYTFLTWITFAFLVVPGYVTYRRRTFNLEGKINAQWSRELGPIGRLRVQDQLQCCGYFSPFVEATISQTCYARSILPGCKKPYLDFERFVLKKWYTASFVLVPFQIAAMVAGLLCSNHVTHRFGKGMMPEAYRLNMGTMAAIMESYANQLAEQYGSEVADEILRKSRTAVAVGVAGATVGGDSTASLNTPTYGEPTHAPLSPYHVKYDSLGGPKGGF